MINVIAVSSLLLLIAYGLFENVGQEICEVEISLLAVTMALSLLLRGEALDS